MEWLILYIILSLGTYVALDIADENDRWRNFKCSTLSPIFLVVMIVSALYRYLGKEDDSE